MSDPNPRIIEHRDEPIVAEMEARGWVYAGPAWDPWTKRFCGQFIKAPEGEVNA